MLYPHWKQCGYYQRPCQKKVERKKKKKSWKSAVPLCFPLTANHSQAQIIHMYRTPCSLMHAAGPSLQMNAPLDIILIKVQSIFSSFACSGVSKGLFIKLFPSILLHPPLLLLLFRLRQGTSWVGGRGCESRRWLYVRVENPAGSPHESLGVRYLRDRIGQHGKGGRGSRCSSVISDGLLLMATSCICTHIKDRGRVNESLRGSLFGLQVDWLVKRAANRRDCLVSEDERWIRVTFSWVIPCLGSPLLHPHTQTAWSSAVGDDG